jgi:hypothetical protein
MKEKEILRFALKFEGEAEDLFFFASAMRSGG